MKEAIGGVFSIQIVFMFLLLVNGYMAYSVNYTRAFRVKNGIINIIEESEGMTTRGNVNAQKKISEYVDKMQYGSYGTISSSLQALSGKTDKNGNTWRCFTQDGYCVKCNPNTKGSSGERLDATSDEYRGVYYNVVTFVNMEIPIIRNLLDLSDFLQVKGETKTIYSANGCPAL